MADQNFPSPAPGFRGARQSQPKNFFDTASKWQIPGLNLPPASTLALYASRLVDKETGESYSADELADFLRLAPVRYLTAADCPGDVYELQRGDNGMVLLLDVANPTIIGIPNLTTKLPIGFNAAIVPWGAGSLTFATDAGNIRSKDGLVETAGQYGPVSLLIPLADNFLLSGSLA